ncbi:hypothetical protein HK102_008374, partial [Quaeritorhiza haematococci]
MGATESKLAFRKNVFMLYEQRNIPSTDSEYWQRFYQLPETAEDVFNLFSPKDIRKVRDAAPENLRTLITKVLERIFTFVSPDAPIPTKEDILQVLNCIRILTRILPYIFETQSDEFEERLFWSSSPVGGTESEGAEQQEQQKDDPLGALLVKAVIKLLFSRTFTLPDVVSETPGIHYVIWYQGIGASVAPPSSKELAQARTETLRLLLTLLSRTMYCPPASVLRSQNKYAHVIATGLEKKAVLSLLCSLLNTVVNYDPVGWALIPYNHVIFADTMEHLASMSLQTLVALLDIGYPSKTPSPTTSIT